MRIGIAADHGGFGLKEDLHGRLTAAGHDVVDFGANRLEQGDDYQDFVTQLARRCSVGNRGARGRGLWQRCGCFCMRRQGSGCARCSDKRSLFGSARVEDDHMNIICLGGRVMGTMVAWDLVETFLAAEFSQADRHLRRLSKVAALEKKSVDGVAAGTLAIPA